jgi:hypothetical protein
VDYAALLDECLRGLFGSAAIELKPVFEKMQQALQRVEAGKAGESLFLSTYNAADPARGSFLPDAYNVGYLLEQIGPGFLDGALARARSKAANDRERRQVEHFCAITTYWRRSAEALGTELRARQAEKTGEKALAASLYRRALNQQEATVQYARSLPPRGWISVTVPRVWRRSMNDIKKRLAALA